MVDLENVQLTPKQKKNQAKIKKELLKQLEVRKLTGLIWRDRVETYIKYWEIEQKLLLDIEIRGPNVFWDNGGGQTGVKKNDSLTYLTKISKEMRDLLSFLNLKPVEVEGGEDGDDNI